MTLKAKPGAMEFGPRQADLTAPATDAAPQWVSGATAIVDGRPTFVGGEGETVNDPSNHEPPPSFRPTSRPPRKMFPHQPPLEWATGGPQGDTAATLRRAPTVEYAAPVVPPPVFPHHTNRNSVYAAGVRHVERQSAVLAATPPTKAGPNGGGGVGERITMLEAEVNALRAQLAASAATPQAAPKAGPAPQQPQQSVQQMIDAAQSRAYRDAVEFANRAAIKPVGLGG